MIRVRINKIIIILWNKLRKCILSQNLTQFSLFVQNLTSCEIKYCTKQQEKIEKLLKQNQWQKGEKFWKSVVVTKLNELNETN